MKQETARVSPHATSKISVSRLPFSEIPGSTRLFLDYLRDPVSLRRYYPNAVASPQDVAGFASSVLKNYRTNRESMSGALVRLNASLGGSAATVANARLLGEPDTVAVVTGQQAGLFTGPLYTIYKALSAISMAEELTAGGIKAVPVFWIATEDHDLDEVAETFCVGRPGQVFRTAHRPAGARDDLPVGNIALDNQVELVVDALFAELPATAFTSSTRQMLTNAWQPGATFGEAFAKTILQLFSRYGLVVIDPLDPEIKRLAAPIYEQAIHKADDIVDSVRKRSSELESDGYHTQVVIEEDYFPLFWHNDAGQRIGLRRTSDGRYRAKDGSVEFDSREGIALAKDEPRLFSPGVMLRPVVQDYLLPTICYFGGAAEVAYFAQNAEVYRLLDRLVTPILHRQSFTIVQPKQRRNLDKLNLKLNDLFKGKQQILLDAAKGDNDGTAKLFAEVADKINNELDRIDQELIDIDPTLSTNLATRRRKIIYHIETLAKKTLRARSRKDETTVDRVDGLLAGLLPNGALQERSLNVFGYTNEFGLNFIDWLYDAVDLEDKDHRIVDV